MLFTTKTAKTEREYQGHIYTTVFTIFYFLGVKYKTKTTTTETKLPPIKSIERYGQTLSIGDRVIVRSNEPDDLMVCSIVQFDDFDGKQYHNPFPIILDEKDGQEYLSFGLMFHYDQELFDLLQTMPSIEQHNYLIAKYIPHGTQIKEKYGIKYKTF